MNDLDFLKGIELDIIDDKIFYILSDLNRVLDLGLDFKEADHSYLVIEARQTLIDFIKESRE